jgi:two-component system copper resistance phosphate regulon response regulator CusR
MRILVVEDDWKQSDHLRRGLIEAGDHAVDVASCGDDGLRRAMAEHYDLFVLDVMLPGLDGFGLLTAIRGFSTAPVLMLTARDRVEDRVHGLSNGADDYLVKPFAVPEFLARVHALLRRSETQRNSQQSQPQLEDLELDPSGRQIMLTAQEYALLALLLHHQGTVLSRNELAEQLWGVSFDSDTNVIEVAIRRLRLKLDQPEEAKLLHTVRGMGYVLELR